MGRLRKGAGVVLGQGAICILHMGAAALPRLPPPLGQGRVQVRSAVLILTPRLGTQPQGT
mgnify:CR=1 FL=1